VYLSSLGSSQIYYSEIYCVGVEWTIMAGVMWSEVQRCIPAALARDETTIIYANYTDLGHAVEHASGYASAIMALVSFL
jgi:hypothetical protein